MSHTVLGIRNSKMRKIGSREGAAHRESYMNE